MVKEAMYYFYMYKIYYFDIMLLKITDHDSEPAGN